jgi:hypothetical protein
MSHAEALLPALEAAPALAPPLAADAPEDLRPFIDAQRRMLDELTELGLRATRAVVAQAESDTPPPASEIALAYARVSRAVRLTIMLQGKLLEARDDEGEIQESYTPVYRQKARVEKVVERLAAEQCEREERFDAIVAGAGDRLDDEDLYGDLMDRPMSEIVDRLCRDLGLDPDWSELSQELWARREAASDEPGAPLRALVPAADGDSLRPPAEAGEDGGAAEAGAPADSS